MRQTLKKLILATLLISAVFLIKSDLATAATFTVTNSNDSGPGSLRKAISDTNDLGGANTINFNISGSGQHIITLLSDLPQASSEILIDGTTQSGTVCGANPTINVAIDGDDANSGITLNTANSTVQGLAFINISSSSSALNLYNGDQTVRCNLFGTLSASNTNNASGHSGFQAISGYNYSGIIIGGTNTSDRNFFYNTYRAIGSGFSFLGNVVVGTQQDPLDGESRYRPVITDVQESGGNTTFTVLHSISSNVRLEFYENATYKNSNGQYDATTYLGVQTASSERRGEMYISQVTISGDNFTNPTVFATEVNGSTFSQTRGPGGYQEPNDMSVVMTGPSSTCYPSGAADQTLKVVVKNNGPNTVDQFTLDGELDGVTALSMTGGTASPSNFDGNDSWTGNMSPGETVEFTITADFGTSRTYGGNLRVISFSFQSKDYIDNVSTNDYGFYFGINCDYLADFKISTRLNEPGLVNGHPGSYTFTIQNIGPKEFTSDNNSDNSSLVGFMYFPEELTVGTFSAPTGLECETIDLATNTSNDLDSFKAYYPTGTVLSCNSSDGHTFGVNEQYNLTVNVTPTNASSNTTVKAWFASFSDPDIIDYYTLFGFGGDLYGRPSNSRAIFTGMRAGSSDDPASQSALAGTGINKNKVLLAAFFAVLSGGAALYMTKRKKHIFRQLR